MAGRLSRLGMATVWTDRGWGNPSVVRLAVLSRAKDGEGVFDWIQQENRPG